MLGCGMIICQNTIEHNRNYCALPLVGLFLAKTSCKFLREKILQIPRYDNLLINTYVF